MIQCLLYPRRRASVTMATSEPTTQIMFPPPICAPRGWREETGEGGELESDLRAEDGAVVVDEAGGDELMSRLCGSKAELHDAFLS